MMLLPLLLQILFLALVTSDGRYLVILGERRSVVPVLCCENSTLMSTVFGGLKGLLQPPSRLLPQ